MEIDVNQAIEQIADKLGVAVSELYPALYKQTIIDAVMNGVWVLLFAIIIAGFIFGIRFIKRKQDEEEYASDWDWDEPGPALFLLVGGILTIISLIAIPINISNGLTALLNPDFYILYWVLKIIAGS